MIKVIQSNIQHAKAASSLLTKVINDKKIDFALIQEPWLSPQGEIRGLNLSGHKITSFHHKPRACIISNANINVSPIPNFVSRDLVAVKIGTSGGGSFVLASGYFSHDRETPPREVEDLVDYCGQRGLPLALGCDANARHLLWSSSDTNSRGKELLEFLNRAKLIFLNKGGKPTFQNCIREEVLDLTICSENFEKFIENWHVSSEDSLSDHNHILFNISESAKSKPVSFRNPRKCDWDSFQKSAKENLRDNPLCYNSRVGLEATVQQMTSSLVSAFEEHCPLSSCKRNKPVNWWNGHLEALQNENRRLLKRSKRSGREKHVRDHKEFQNFFKQEIRKSKLAAWQNFCSNISSCNASTRLYKSLGKCKSIAEQPILRSDGSFTDSDSDALTELLSYHFPGCNLNGDSGQPLSQQWQFAGRDSKLAGKIVTFAKVKAAVNLLSPYKAAGHDGITPIMIQKTLDDIVPILVNVFRASLRMGYIPVGWRKVNVVFIPKPGHVNQSAPSAFRPISLSSFFLKILERLLEWFIRKEIDDQGGLNPQQHAYRKGRSVDTALVTLRQKIESSLECKEIALGAFLDIQGAFNNVLFSAVEKALNEWRLPDFVVKWILNMLGLREAFARRGDSAVSALVARGCPQGGILSTLLWSLVVDSLLKELHAAGFHALAYADDVAIIVKGLFSKIAGERMNVALKIVSNWCQGKGLSVNPQKAELILFSRRRNVQLLPDIVLSGETIKLVETVKYLGVIFDSKLLWKEHLSLAIRKSTVCFWMIRRMVGNTWGLSPKIVHDLYISLVRPVLCFGCVAWWKRADLACSKSSLQSLQRLACIGITGAFRTTPTAALEVILNLPPLDIFIKEQAALALDRVQQCGIAIRPQGNVGKGSPLSLLASFGNIPRDSIVPCFDFSTIEVSFPTRESWLTEETRNQLLTDREVWFTDGSVMDGKAGVGVFCEEPECNLVLSLGDTSIFQAETLAIELALREAAKGTGTKEIIICSDSQAALKAISSFSASSLAVLNCKKAYTQLKRKATLVWVPGHEGIVGNEKADELARLGSSTRPIGPEPFLPVPRSFIRKQYSINTKAAIQAAWNRADYRQSKLLVTGANAANSRYLLSLHRRPLKIIVSFLTGHGDFKSHLVKLNLVHESDRQCICGLDEESAYHLLCECPRHWAKRQESLGNAFLGTDDCKRLKFLDVCKFILKIGRRF